MAIYSTIEPRLQSIHEVNSSTSSFINKQYSEYRGETLEPSIEYSLLDNKDRNINLQDIDLKGSQFQTYSYNTKKLFKQYTISYKDTSLSSDVVLFKGSGYNLPAYVKMSGLIHYVHLETKPAVFIISPWIIVDSQRFHGYTMIPIIAASNSITLQNSTTNRHNTSKRTVDSLPLYQKTTTYKVNNNELEGVQQRYLYDTKVFLEKTLPISVSGYNYQVGYTVHVKYLDPTTNVSVNTFANTPTGIDVQDTKKSVYATKR